MFHFFFDLVHGLYYRHRYLVSIKLHRRLLIMNIYRLGDFILLLIIQFEISDWLQYNGRGLILGLFRLLDQFGLILLIWVFGLFNSLWLHQVFDLLIVLFVELIVVFLEFIGVHLFKDFLIASIQSIDLIWVLLDPVVGVLHYLLVIQVFCLSHTQVIRLLVEIVTHQVRVSL